MRPFAKQKTKKSMTSRFYAFKKNLAINTENSKGYLEGFLYLAPLLRSKRDIKKAAGISSLLLLNYFSFFGNSVYQTEPEIQMEE